MGLDVSPCPCWLPTRGKHPDGGRHAGACLLFLCACAGSLREASVLMVADAQGWFRSFLPARAGSKCLDGSRHAGAGLAVSLELLLTTGLHCVHTPFPPKHV